MNREERLRILNNRIGMGDCYDFGIEHYKEELRKFGYDDELTDRTLYYDLKEALGGTSWLKSRIKFLALQNGNINVALGATNKLLDMEPPPYFDKSAPAKGFDNDAR